MEHLITSVKKSRKHSHDQLFGMAITAPSVILLALLFLYPIAYSLVISFTNYNYVRGTMNFVGFTNYLRAFEDADFLNALRVTFIISIASVVVQFIVGVLLSAFIVNMRRGQGFLKSAYLIPMMIAPTVAGLLWRFLLNNEFGAINHLLGAAGITTIPWLVNERLALICVVIVDSWTSIPYVFLLMYTALTTVSADMLEAGTIDGANSWQIFFRIQLPSIRAALMVALVIRFMDVFRIYDSIDIMTKGGPGTATEALSLYIYRVNWTKYQMGKASAMSYIMMVVMAVIGLLMQYYSEDKHDRAMRRERRRAK